MCGKQGEKNDLTNYPYLYFNRPAIGSGILSKSICVKQCPTGANQTVECFPTQNIKDCSDITSYSSFEFFNGFCIPTEKAVLDAVSSLFSGFNAESIAESVYLNRKIILACFVMAFALSYFFSFFLEHCTWLIVLLSLVGIFALGLFLSMLCWKKHNTLLSEVGQSATEGDDNTKSIAGFYKWSAIGLWILLSMFAIGLVCLCGKIKIAIKVIEAAAQFVSEYKGIILVPIVLIFITAGFVALWLFGLAGIFSTGDVYHNKSYPWGKIKTNEEMK